MSFRDLSPLTLDALSDVGIHVFDASVLGSFSFSSTIENLLVPRSASAVLTAITTARRDGIDADPSTLWSSEKKQALRKFFFDEIVSKVKFLSEDQAESLKGFSIWPCVSETQETQLYCSITSQKVPPAGAPSQFLSRAFIKLTEERERALYLRLHIEAMSVTELVINQNPV